MSNWTEERVAVLENAVNEGEVVTLETVADLAEELEVSGRSVAAKLRKMGYEVEKVSAKPKAFSDEQEAALRDFLDDHQGEFTYGEIAEQFAGGEFSPKQIQGKVLSMELTDFVKPTPKKESVKTYTEEEETKFVKLAAAGAFLEDIADAVGKSLASVRGKALSLLRAGEIEKIPAQRETHAKTKVDPLEQLGDKIADMTVAEIAEAIGKTERGVKQMITYRNLECADYKARPKKDAA